MRIPDAFLDELRTRVPLHSIVSRRVDLKRSGNHWVGRCPKPDHDDKTPSFHVWDDHVKCFGCGMHTDCIGFVMETEKVSFREAVTRLAAEVGLDMPKQPDELPQVTRKRRLSEVLQLHADEWHKALYTEAGHPALDYLYGRGIADETLAAFQVGWSSGPLLPGMERDDLAEAGLLAISENGRPFPFFRQRITVPIRDRWGRIVSFTARVLDPGNSAKWINTRNTDLYDKSKALFGIEKAIPEASLVFVEGAMDVMACYQAGTPAVAPLGTALTRDHFEEAWRVCASPILAMDGDKAGADATERAVKTALPHITPEHSLRVTLLPKGKDPASMGSDGYNLVVLVAEAMSLDEALFRQVVGDRKPSAPEANAILEERLVDLANTIQHAGMRREYYRALKDRFWEWRTNRACPALVHSMPDLHHNSTRAQQIEQLRQEIEDARVRLVELDEASPEEMTKACNLLRNRVEALIEFMSEVEEISSHG